MKIVPLGSTTPLAKFSGGQRSSGREDGVHVACNRERGAAVERL